MHVRPPSPFNDITSSQEGLTHACTRTYVGVYVPWNHHRCTAATGHDMRGRHQQQIGSLFLLRHSLAVASKMRRGIRSFCHGVGSTSTMQQLHMAGGGTDGDAASFLNVPSSVVGSCVTESEVTGTGAGDPAQAAVTLEQMILQLDLEEEAARKARGAAGTEECYYPRRMSCVNSSDHVLRSARDALSQYPRFSLDGRDAMYRASFSSYYEGMGLAAMPRDGANATVVAGGRHGSHRRASVCCAAGAGYCRARACGAEGYEMDLERTLRMPATVAGESVVWCKPGVVAKLMGLEAVPVPVRGGRRSGSMGRRKASGPPASSVGIVGGGGRKQRLRRVGKEELEKERLFMALHGYDVARASASHAGALHATVGPNVSGMGREGDGWEFRLPS